MEQKPEMTKSEKFSKTITGWIGSDQSLIAHTIFFVGIFALRLFGVSSSDILLILTTLVSLEAIYLAIFIQMTVNKQAQELEEISEDVDEIQGDVDEIQKDIDEIQEDVEEIQEDDEDDDVTEISRFEYIEHKIHALLEEVHTLTELKKIEDQEANQEEAKKEQKTIS